MIDYWFFIIDDWKWWSGGGATKNPEDVDLAKFGEKTKTDPRWIYDEDRSGPGTIIFMIDNEFWWWWWLWWIYNGDWSLVGAIKIMNTTKMTIVTMTQEIVLLFDIVLMIVLIFEIVLRTMTIVMIRNLFCSVWLLSIKCLHRHCRPQRAQKTCRLLDIRWEKIIWTLGERKIKKDITSGKIN